MIGEGNGRSDESLVKPPMDDDRVLAILRDVNVKSLAREYYRLTGKPLGITGEVAEYKAARVLGVELTSARRGFIKNLKDALDRMT